MAIHENLEIESMHHIISVALFDDKKVMASVNCDVKEFPVNRSVHVGQVVAATLFEGYPDDALILHIVGMSEPVKVLSRMKYTVSIAE